MLSQHLACTVLLLAAGCTCADFSGAPEPATQADKVRALLKLPDHIKTPEIPKDNPLSEAGIQLGRHLFYDPVLSGTDDQSCSDCHQQALGFTDGRKIAVGARGTPALRNTMSLTNLAWSSALMWDGRAPSLEAQALIPIEDPLEMDQPLDELVTQLQGHPEYPQKFQAAFPDEPISEVLIARALAQFVRTLTSFNAPIDQLATEEDLGRRVDGEGVEFTKQQARGSELLTGRLPKSDPEGILDMCNSCHDQYQGLAAEAGTPSGVENHDIRGLFSGTGLSHNGLSDSPDVFVIPTIRNIALTGPYMHDGRFETLTEVLEHYNAHMADVPQLDPRLRGPGGPHRLKLSPVDIEDMVALLDLFTDETFLNNAAFGPPENSQP
jgi:cytochrome c peroxidase